MDIANNRAKPPRISDNRIIGWGLSDVQTKSSKKRLKIQYETKILVKAVRQI